MSIPKNWCWHFLCSKGAKPIEIRIYELTAEGFEPRLITNKASSVMYREHAFSPGTLEIDFPFDEYGSTEFIQHRLVLIDKRFAGFIRDVHYSEAADNMMKISGTDLKGLLADRIVIPMNMTADDGTAGYDAIIGDTETCIKHYWENNIGAAASLHRRLPFLHIGENLHRGKADDRYMTRFQYLSDVTAELAGDGGLVVVTAVNIENARFIFDVKEPTDRTASGNNSPVVLSVELKTALSMDYDNILSGSSNAFYASRSGEKFADETFTALYTRENTDEPFGIFRSERHLNVSVSTPEAGNEYSEMERQALHMMLEYEPQESLTAKINFTRLVEHRDYELGDTVTVQSRKWGVETDVQITALEHHESGGDMSITATLGNGDRNIIRSITREIRNI